VTVDLTRATHGGRRADRRVGYGRQRVPLQHTLPRSLWRALRGPALWMAGRRHLPVLLTVGNDADAQLAANIATIRQGFTAQIEAMKDSLAVWVEENSTRGNGGVITVALLELAIERHLNHFDEKSAADLMQGALDKVLRRKRGPVQ
jgi:hypothetical protein